MNPPRTPAKVTVKIRLLTSAEFQRLAEVPQEVEWFKNIRNPNTKRAYQNAIQDFMLFAGIKRRRAARGPGREIFKGYQGPGDSGHPALPRPPTRGIVQADCQGFRA